MNIGNVLLLGGGLDSVAYLIHMSNHIWPVPKDLTFQALWVDYGQAARDGELLACSHFCDKYGVRLHTKTNDQIQWLNPHGGQLFTGKAGDDPYVDGRNMSFIMQALEIGNSVYLGFADPGYQPFPDATPTFVSTINKLLKMIFKSVEVNGTRHEARVLAPWETTNRVDFLTEAYRLDDELFERSFTCWTPDDQGQECGKCRHCKLKSEQYAKVLVHAQESNR